MKLSEYNFPTLSKVDMAFSNLTVSPELLKIAKSRECLKGKKKFNELFFNGGKIELQKNVKDTWKEKAFLYAKSLMGSFEPKHQDKEVVCAMIFEEVLVLE